MANHNKTCHICKNTFTAKSSNTKYCSPKCSNATPELIKAKWEASDKTCCLCGLPIDRTLRPPHPDSYTLEHLTPITRGGRHDIDNIGFAHRGCNSSKGAKTLEEYMESKRQVA